MYREQLNVARHPLGGYYVRLMVLPGSDEMWVERRHPAIFKCEKRAERFMARMRHARLDLSKWIGDDWVGSPLRVDESANPAPYCVL